MSKRISAPMMSAAMPSSEAPLAAVAVASPVTSGPLHLENPRVVGISPTRPATLKTPQASSAAAWWSRVVTVQIGPRHAVDPVTMVASQTAQKSSTGTNAHSAHRSRRGTRTVPDSTAGRPRPSPRARRKWHLETTAGRPVLQMQVAGSGLAEGSGCRSCGLGLRSNSDGCPWQLLEF